MVTTKPSLTVSSAARAFADERGVSSDLHAVADITGLIFPDARCLAADLHEDPDVPGWRWIVFRVEVEWKDAERARSARDQWYARTAEVCPGRSLNEFGLEIDRRPG